MAGIGGTCTHAAALLFYMEAAVRIREKKTVTQEKAYWLLPTSINKVPYSEVSDIDFTSSKTKKNKLDSSISGHSVESCTPSPQKHNQIPSPTDDEINKFFQKLNISESSASVLSVTKPYNNKFVPKELEIKSRPLSELKTPECVNMNAHELRTKCAGVQIAITAEDADLIERSTRKQAKSKSWFRYRAGRITASNMKAACRTNPDSPSKSLINSICYPESVSFSTKATTWGCEHENVAREKYHSFNTENHHKFRLDPSGLHIHPSYPHLGATPDGLVSCDCCGQGVLEIKCPYSVKDATKHDCLTHTSVGLTLSKTHSYYFQIQSQIFICQKEFCDFVLWTEGTVHMERILPDAEFWQEISQQASFFFHNVILLELVGQFYSNPRVGDTETRTHTNKKYCFCKKDIPGGKMIACDGDKCEIEWFHYPCVGVKRKPKGQWFCPNCCKKSKNDE